MGQLQQQMKKVVSVSTTAVEIDQFLDKLRKELTGNSKIYPQRLVTFLEGLYARRQSVWQKAARLKPNTYKKIAEEVMQHLKQELIGQLQPIQHENKMIHQKWPRDLDEQSTKLTFLQNKHMQMMATAEMIPNVKELLQQKETKALELQQRKEQFKEAKLRVDHNRQKHAKEALELQKTEQLRTQVEARLEKLYRLLNEKEEELAPIQEILSTQPEQEHEKVLRNLASISFTRESLKQEKQKLPLFQSIQGMWLSLLKEANEHDLNEIRKLYVKHSNVIGTTCVASARRDFIESYPVFDVVIIDEVSKATPPELLLPMLKGKKIILVGDHHQLPPLLGDDTLEETLQEMAEKSEDFEGKAE